MPTPASSICIGSWSIRAAFELESAPPWFGAALAAEPEADRAVVQTGSSNEPAKQLYRREGFEEIDEVEVVPGLRVTRFGRRL